MTAESIALNRFGLGARPGDPVPADPRAWLLSQLDAYEALPAAWQALPHTQAQTQAWIAQQRAARQAPEDQRAAIRDAYQRGARQDLQAAIGARTASALQTPTPFVERLVHFWSNHFAVSVDKQPVVGLAGSFEMDAIRPHVLGRFEDLLLAAVRHPAMLLFLDQARSTGPDSPAGRRSRRRRNAQGLNENLAREILELHTMGVRSGYTQADVLELARALTGWTLPDEEGADTDAAPFRFAPALHEPGARSLLGRSYPDTGEAQARAILHDLATAPVTARHIATKLARHFVADEPPAGLVARLAERFMRSSGDLAAVYRELVMAPESWAAGTGKFKSPWDWGVSSLRALGRRELPAPQAANLMNQLGQPVWRPGSPAGYGDLAATWAAPDALLRRVEAAQRLGAQAGASIDARALAPRILPGGPGEATGTAIARADSPSTALALLLASPEFLRR
ncbi:DUF1800 domain-containing protein [Massilia yuzhufengensis]|uniref:Uncharacterized conserved protein, DUF1800 family n=1 Tax=Massilia yuzhufengensis TaxID=1164594 RepID=A0A1I1F4I8_9BURK|nr:DUF1800 domain-containing protein [Massilia yuzhufengensis]SFB92063.1 Uncharacterized conserved protein, DUF1800 family [Massilia yuzhufengensis]